MNIVLTSLHITKSPDAIPLAPALLKGSLEDNLTDINCNISIVESTLESSNELFIESIIKHDPDVVSFSIYLWNRDFYLKIAKSLKKIKPSLLVIAGGPEIRSSYKDLLRSEIDYTMQGEGEDVICELIKSIYYHSNPVDIPGVNDNQNRSIIKLDDIPSPLVTGNIDLNRYDGYLWELSRGCPFSCDFCFESRGTHGVRYYSFDRIEKELNIIVKNKTPQVFVLDPTFNKDLKRAKKILRLIKKKNRGTHFHFEVRAELLDREIAQLFYDIGASLQIGIQSSHDNILKLINRRIDRKLFKNKVSILNETGNVFGLDLIYGLPGDSYIGFKESMEYVLSLQPNHVDIFPLAVLPGTALCDNSSNLKLNYRKNSPYTVIDSPTYSKEDMIKSEKLKGACDFIYNDCKSTGWLKQVCNELKISMVDFIEKFYYWNNSDSPNGIVTVKKYIKEFYKPKRADLIFDIINYHSSYSKALLSEKIVSKVKADSILNSIPKLSKTTTLTSFNYPILDAFDNGDYTIKEIKKYYKPINNRVVSWFHTGGDVVFDCYSNDIMKFLNKVNGKLKSKDIDKSIDPEFLLFAQDSGMLYFK